MFEQQLYEPEPVTTPLHEGDMFYNYEIKNWDISSRIYKILGISALANTLVILVVAQTSLLTMKGCEDPLVGRVCQVLDVVEVGMTLFGTDRDWVDVNYDKTDLGDAEITYVDVSGITPPLSYPEGYFELANPEQSLAMYQPMSIDDQEGFTSGIPGIPSGIPISPSGGHSLFDTTPNVPTPNPNPIDGGLPGGFGSFSSSPNVTRPPRPKKGRPGRLTSSPVPDPTPGDETIADADPGNSNTAEPIPGISPKPVDGKTVDPTNPVSAYDINKRPFVDLAVTVNDLLDRKLVTLESPFVVNAKGKLTKEGKLDPKTFQWGEVASTDPRMLEVIREAVRAINDSGYLQYIKDTIGKDFNLTLQQDETNISAVLMSELENENLAKQKKSSFDISLLTIKLAKSGDGADQNDKDDLALLENAKVETEGKKIVIRFSVPKDIALPMIQRKLAEQKANPGKPNGTSVVKTDTNTAHK